MKNKTKHIAKIIGLAVCLGALPIVALTSGCVGDGYHQNTSQAIEDHAISSRVESALSANTEYKFDGVNVETFKGTVQLSGFVKTSDQKNEAGDIAKNINGVRNVKNNITVQD